jgi:hypothetical protein
MEDELWKMNYEISFISFQEFMDGELNNPTIQQFNLSTFHF